MLGALVAMASPAPPRCYHVEVCKSNGTVAAIYRYLYSGGVIVRTCAKTAINTNKFAGMAATVPFDLQTSTCEDLGGAGSHCDECAIHKYKTSYNSGSIGAIEMK